MSQTLPEDCGQSNDKSSDSLRANGAGVDYRLNSYSVGCCLGAGCAPLLFILFLVVLFYVAGDFDAEGVPFFLIMSVPCGAVAGAIAGVALWPNIVRGVVTIIQAIKRNSK